MAKKYHGSSSGGVKGVPQKAMQKPYPKCAYGNYGKYKDDQESIDAFGRKAVSKLEKQKYAK
jgi:hypothetical protein